MKAWIKVWIKEKVQLNEGRNLDNVLLSSTTKFSTAGCSTAPPAVNEYTLQCTGTKFSTRTSLCTKFSIP
jgi:hypothetical protein